MTQIIRLLIINSEPCVELLLIKMVTWPRLPSLRCDYCNSKERLLQKKGRHGCIEIDRDGKIVRSFNTTGKYPECIDTTGHKNILIYK